MIEAADIRRIAEEVAREELGTENVVRVVAEPMIDWTGAEAWRVLIVIAPNALSRILGDPLANNLVNLQKEVQRAGDDRFAFVEYATEAELAENDDTEC
jgi:hypothetical protein